MGVLKPKLAAEPVVLVQQLLWDAWVQRSLLVCQEKNNVGFHFTFNLFNL